jgi:hypothetical protein
MSPRRTTTPPTRMHVRSSRHERGELIVEKKRGRSAKEKPALDNRFHRTDLSLSRERPHTRAYMTRNKSEHEGLQAWAKLRPRVGCSSEKLAGRHRGSISYSRRRNDDFDFDAISRAVEIILDAAWIRDATFRIVYKTNEGPTVRMNAIPLNIDYELFP